MREVGELGGGVGGWRGLQHVVNPKQETGEPLFIQ